MPEHMAGADRGRHRPSRSFASIAPRRTQSGRRQGVSASLQEMAAMDRLRAAETRCPELALRTLGALVPGESPSLPGRGAEGSLFCGLLISRGASDLVLVLVADSVAGEGLEDQSLISVDDKLIV